MYTRKHNLNGNKNKAISFCLFIALLLFGSIFLFSSTAETIEERLENELTTSFTKAKQLAKLSSFNGYCGKCTGYQLWAVGIFGAYHGSNGNKTYDLYKRLLPKSGDSVTPFPGKYKDGENTITSILNQLNLSNPDGHQTYTVFSFNTGSNTENGQAYGHVLLVHSVYNGYVYWCESFGESIRVETISSFANTYKENGNKYHFDGAIAFGYKENIIEPPEQLQLNYSTYSLNMNSTLNLSVTAYPNGTSNNVTWSSSDESVATVTNGIVTPHSASRTARITATSAMNPSVSACCDVSTYYQNTDAAQTLKFSEISYPHVYGIGKSWSWSGSVESDVDLSSFTITLYTSSNKFVYTHSIASGTKKINMSSISNVFTQLSAGRFWYEMVAIDSVGRRIGFSHDCQAKSGSSHTVYKYSASYMRPQLIASTSNNGHYYELYKSTDKVWETAVAFAQERGGHLASISDSIENDIICDLCNNNDVAYIFTGGWYDNTGWHWPDNTPFNYYPWKNDVEADGVYQYSPVTAISTSSTKQWSKANRNGVAHFVIEYDPQAVTGIVLECEQALYVGDQISARWTVLPDNAYNKSVIFESSDNTIVSVDPSTGIVTANKEGSAIIYVRAQDGSNIVSEQTIMVSHVPIHIIEIELQTDPAPSSNENTLTVMLGQTISLSASIIPENADYQDVEYYSTDEDVAYIEQYSNIVSTISTGTCRIGVISDDGSFSDEIMLIVIPVSGSCGDNATWSYSDGVLTISGLGKITDYANCEARPWNSYASAIHTVVINAGITHIGEYCFESFTSMTSVSIPDTVTYLAYRAFFNCDSLHSISLPNTLTGIGSACFMDCGSLQSIYIPDSVTIIGYYTFKSCSSLTYVHLSERLTTITYASFADCSSLYSISIPESVVKIGYNAFEGCTNLQEIIVPASVTAIDVSTFPGAEEAYPNLVPALTNCPDVTIYCYDGSTAQTYAISNGISYVIIGGKCGDNVTWRKDGTMLTIFGTGPMYDYEQIPDPWRTSAPWGSNITSVSISEGVTTIGDFAFYFCSNLTGVGLPPTMESFGTGCFEYCTKLPYFTIPNGVETIGVVAFSWCDALQRITIPASVSSIGIGAFCNCFALETFNISSDNQHYYTMDGVLFSRSGALVAYPITKTDTYYTVPDNVKEINTWAFSNANYLKSITIPNSVTIINNEAFDNCGLETINCFEGTAGHSYAMRHGITCNLIDSVMINPDFVAPEYLTIIEENAFEGIASKRIRLGEQVAEIGAYAFANCPNLKQVYIPDYCERIATTAFSGVVELQIFGIEGSYAEWFASRRGFMFISVNE